MPEASRAVRRPSAPVAEDRPPLTWWTQVPGRVARSIWALTAPLRLVVWVLDGLVAAAVVGVLAVGWAWWTQRITDDQVAVVLGQLGGRIIAILSKSGVL